MQFTSGFKIETKQWAYDGRSECATAQAVSKPSLIIAADVSRLTFPVIRLRLERTHPAKRAKRDGYKF